MHDQSTTQITTAGAAEELGLEVSHVRRLCIAGRIQGARKWGRDWMIPSPVVRLDTPSGTGRKMTEEGAATTYQTTYLNARGVRLAAYQLPWAQVSEILGHDHEGDADDDDALVAWLMAHGAPSWIRDAEGWIDGYGWGIVVDRHEEWKRDYMATEGDGQG